MVAMHNYIEFFKKVKGQSEFKLKSKDKGDFKLNSRVKLKILALTVVAGGSIEDCEVTPLCVGCSFMHVGACMHLVD